MRAERGVGAVEELVPRAGGRKRPFDGGPLGCGTADWFSVTPLPLGYYDSFFYMGKGHILRTFGYSDPRLLYIHLIFIDASLCTEYRLRRLFTMDFVPHIM